MLAMTILVSPITDTSAATNTHLEESWPSHPVFTPTPSVATAATMMMPIAIDAGTIELRQNASAECLSAVPFCRQRRWSGITVATCFPCGCLMLYCTARRKLWHLPLRLRATIDNAASLVKSRRRTPLTLHVP